MFCSHVVVFGMSMRFLVVPYVDAVVAVTDPCTVVCGTCVYAERV